MTKNNYRDEICNLIHSSQSSIKIAVSWFTDEYIVKQLVSKVNHRSIEILLSADDTNLFRHQQFRTLINNGAKVRKLGSKNAIHGEFMHSKFIVIDNNRAYGGSYNFTANAATNYEQFQQYSSVSDTLNKFNNWMQSSQDFFEDVHNPDAIVAELIKKFEEEEKTRQVIQKSISSGLVSRILNTEQKVSIASVSSLINSTTERTEIIKSEAKARTLTATASAITTQTQGVTRSGAISESQGLTSRPHKFHGGNIPMVHFLSKSSLSPYARLIQQKRGIEQQFDFLKCEIKKNLLLIKGTFNAPNCDAYDVCISYQAGLAPSVFIERPNVGINAKNHIYSNGSLCLFYPPETKWSEKHSIASYTIPWIFEWIVNYELRKLTGEWFAPEQVH